jgi:hypothetical protein
MFEPIYISGERERFKFSCLKGEITAERAGERSDDTP